MKKTIKDISKTFAILLIVLVSYTVSAQPPPPPGGSGGGGGTQGDKLGGDAPIGAGLFILLGLGAAYGGRKFYKMKMEGSEE